jgi:hypothetical protein
MKNETKDLVIAGGIGLLAGAVLHNLLMGRRMAAEALADGARSTGMQPQGEGTTTVVVYEETDAPDAVISATLVERMRRAEAGGRGGQDWWLAGGTRPPREYPMTRQSDGRWLARVEPGEYWLTVEARGLPPINSPLVAMPGVRNTVTRTSATDAGRNAGTMPQ